MNEAAYGILVAVVACFAMVAVSSFVLHYIIALKSPPTTRAAWTSGLSYAAVVIGISFSDLQDYQLWAPLVAAPALGAVFWYWRSEFRNAWVDDSKALAEGETLANDDWRMGLVTIIAFMALGALKVIVRLAMQ